MSVRAKKSRALQRRDAMHSHSLHFGPNMTPMVDIVMVILIFFMASAAFMGDEWFLRAAIPFEAGRGTAVNKPNDPLAIAPTRLDVNLDVDKQGQTIVSVSGMQGLNEVPLDRFVEWASALPRTKETAEIEVLLRPTGPVPYRDVVRAHSACDVAGIVKVGISAKRGVPGPSATPGGAGIPALP